MSRQVADWLWEPFNKDSEVLYAWSGGDDYRRWDEDAALELARCLSWRDFPNVRFRQVLAPAESIGDLQGEIQTPNAVCLIGGFARFGPEAKLRFANPRARFHFESGSASFHRLVDRWAPDRSLETSEDDRERTDHGLIQRHFVNGIYVVNCWGPSMLGTLAAAEYAGRQLRSPDTPFADWPYRIQDKDCLEARLKVWAKVEKTRPWKPVSQLENLTIGQREWTPETGWQNATKGRIEVQVVTNGETDYPACTILEINIDGHERKVQVGKSKERLLSYLLCRGRATIGQLAEEETMWPNRNYTKREMNNRINAFIEDLDGVLDKDTTGSLDDFAVTWRRGVLLEILNRC